MTSTTFFIIFIPILSVILLAVNLLLAPHNPYQEKDSVFECGFHSFLGQNRTQFSISFFIFGILFLLFDLEIVLIYPYSVSSYTNDIYGLGIMLLFFVLLTLGFIFELGKGALSIDSKQTFISANSDNSPNVDTFYSFGLELQSSITHILLSNIIKNTIKYAVSAFKQTFCDKMVWYLQSRLTVLLKKYPKIYLKLETLFSISIIFYSYSSNAMYNLNNYIKKKVPLFHAISIYVYSEYLSLTKGNVTNNVLFFLSFYIIYNFNNLEYIGLYLLLFTSELIKRELQDNIWFASNYPKTTNILIKLCAAFNVILVFILLTTIYIEVILPILRNISNYILKMATPSPNSPGNTDPGSNNYPGNNNNPKPQNTFLKSKTIKSKKEFKKKHNLNEEESKKLDLGIELVQLQTACDNLLAIENKHDNSKEIKDTFLDFIDKYRKWLPKEAKTEVDNIRESFTDLGLNESNGKYREAKNVLTYWKLVKEDTKVINSSQNKIAQVFEKNSKRLQRDNLGGIGSIQSKEFINDLNELKNVNSSYYKLKNSLIVNQINKANRIDSILKKNNVSMQTLFQDQILK